MATAVVSGASTNTVSVEERRWVVVGICLTKVLTPALRHVLANEMPTWYNHLCLASSAIDKQIFPSQLKKLPPSTMKLNYESINNNFNTHKSSYSHYDYAVKDSVSLAKLFMKQFMASFTGFDQSMDTSAALSVVAEAQPFHASGAGGWAKNIRSGIRNEWAHCNFAHWTDVKYQTALKDMESLINNLNLTHVEKKRVIDDLDGWKNNGLKLCFGQAVDSELLKLVNTEVAKLHDTVKLWKEDVDCNQTRILKTLKSVEMSLEQEIQDLKGRQLRTEEDIEQLRFGQLALYETISRKHGEEPRYLFVAPRQTQWFSGRASELDYLHEVLEKENTSCKEKIIVAAVSGLGGTGKTSLVAEYTHKWKDHYEGGVYWFSGEDDVTLKASVDDVAAQFDTLHDNSLDATLSKTLAVLSRIKKPWLMVVDDMDELNLSQNLRKLVSGSWQANVACLGHLVITTRRTSKQLKEFMHDFRESRCLKLECLGCEEAKCFVFKRTGIVCNEQTDSTADRLVQKLGGLPLALEQACAYIIYVKCTLAVYLESYEKQSLKLLNKKKARPVYETSPERLAVSTTWHLNFEHIRKNENGIFAIRFLNASSFMSPNEIQEELINVGKPRVEDDAYCEQVSTFLGAREVLTLLTDFSLFKQTHNSSLSVHRLVQEVIRENLNPEEKVESIVDAARLLRFAFSNCLSPDVLSKIVLGEQSDRSSLHGADFCRFYKWHKLCLHTYEIKKNLEKYLGIFTNVKVKTVFLPEVARILYECALHLNVNNYSSEAKTVADFANRIVDWCGHLLSEEQLDALFPHVFPLSQPLRRLIQYSCRAPLETNNPTISDNRANNSTKSEIETMRLEGIKLFMESNFEEALEIFSSCIDNSKRTESFDPQLFCNRASAHLRLKQYRNALEDAEEYIRFSSVCWKGHARKAVALDSLDEKWDAVASAALAFYHNQDVFENFSPLKAAFPDLKHRIHICDDVSSLVALLSHLALGNFSVIPSKIIVLKPGEYRLSAEHFNRFQVEEDPVFGVKRLSTGNLLLLAVDDRSSKPSVKLSFVGNLGIGVFSHSFMAVSISFSFNLGNWRTGRDSRVRFCNCSFTSNQSQHVFFSEGSLTVRKCQFANCKGSALCVVGDANVVDSVFSGNDSVGLQVLNMSGDRGNLALKNSELYGNTWGLDVKSGSCDVTSCQIYDNKKIGVGIGNGNVKLTRNEIFHNDRHGIYLCEKSSAVIEENVVFENGLYGIEAMDDAWCRVSRNKIYRNKCGGVHVVPIALENRQSVIEFNQIFENEGPGIDQEISYSDSVGSPDPSEDVIFRTLVKKKENLVKAKCHGNVFKDNIDNGSPPPSQKVAEVCFSCSKEGQLKKCMKCFTAGYCNQECQKSDWKNHKKNCVRLLEKYSVLVEVLPKSSGLKGDKRIFGELEVKAPFKWLEPSGPKYAKPPEYGKRVIVKIQAGDGERKSNCGGSLLTIEDRSLTINGDLDKDEHSGHIYNLVRECGSNCESYGWKKKFLWALLDRGKIVRVFITDFPAYQRW